MKSFFKIFFASTLGTIFGSILLVLIGFAILIGLASSLQDSEKVTIENPSVLHINFDAGILERAPENPFEDIEIPGFPSTKILSLNELLDNINKAKNDSNIKAIFMDFGMMFSAGLATIDDLRAALIDFKSSGKKIYAYSEFYSERSYYLASVADQVFINPAGDFIFNGFYSSVTFFKGMLDKAGIEMQVIKVGKYKSAVEPFLLDKMSDENREQVSVYVNSLFDAYTSNIATSRKLSQDTIKNIANNLMIRKAQDAVDLKMIDALKYYDEVLEIIKKESGTEKDGKPRFITYSSFRKVNHSKKEDFKNKIAVVYINGEIVGGKGDENTAASGTLVEAIQKIRDDENVKALVVRVNSPGGSSLASDVILREIKLCHEKMPVIVSMGDVAASGGYYVSMAGDTIVAQPNTITGSIGVFGLIPNFKTLLNEKLGIHSDGVGTGKFSDLGSVDRALTEDEKLFYQQMVDRIYEDFLKHVSENRKMSIEQVHEIAQGRVWTGTDAKRLGLVDVLGNFNDAIQIAINKAGLTSYAIVEYPKIKDPFSQILNMGEQSKVKMIKQELGSFYSYFEKLKSVQNLNGTQMRVPYIFEIQ